MRRRRKRSSDGFSAAGTTDGPPQEEITILGRKEIRDAAACSRCGAAIGMPCHGPPSGMSHLDRIQAAQIKDQGVVPAGGGRGPDRA